MQLLERIAPLDDAVIAQIAAGEVIERPVSVVKELVENSLDAGARWISVQVWSGGRDRISVHDDGHGIAADQIALSLQRHCTSKLVSAAQLFAIRTLGFRGEGLASIAAAAGRVTIVSRCANQEFGAQVEAQAGRISGVTTIAASPGTLVEVNNLFADTPVRRQFLKSERTEFARISAYLTQLALGWPQVSFALHHDGQPVWHLPAVDTASDRIEMAFGKGARATLLPVEVHVDVETSVTGFTSAPGDDRPNRASQVLLVNGRLVRSAQLSVAWSRAYESLLASGRYPFGVLSLRVPSDEVDVNVHPAKLEVRFLNNAGVFELIRSAVQRTLRGQSQQAQPLPVPVMPADELAAAGPSTSLPAIEAPQLSLLRSTATSSGSSGARPLGQIDATFIAIADTERIIVIDQHAAHERVVYEALRDRADAETVVEPLLVPALIELSADEAAVLEAHAEALAAAGVELEHFGDLTYRIAALPAIFGRRPIDVRGMLAELSQGEDRRSGLSSHERLLATIACHAVVRAHEPLTLEEQVALYEALRGCNAPQTCPHGRPTMLQLDAGVLARAFGRSP